jgi:hypothetical protein
MRPNYNQWREQEAFRRISEEEARQRWNLLNQRIIRERFDVPINTKANSASAGGGGLRNNETLGDFNDDFNNDFN